MADCKNCIHIEVCKSADSCDGRVPGCRHFEPKTKHGRWAHDAVQVCGLFDDSLPVWVDVMQCSVCKEYIEGSHGTYYCPNCGAIMDLERSTDNENHN